MDLLKTDVEESLHLGGGGGGDTALHERFRLYVT